MSFQIIRWSREGTVNRLAVAAATGGLLFIIGACVSSSAAAQPTPTLEDAAKAAAEELKQLPASAIQVDCSPDFKTLPPYTRLTGGVLGGPQRSFILSDGRCYVDPAVPPDAGLSPYLIEGPSADPGADPP